MLISFASCFVIQNNRETTGAGLFIQPAVSWEKALPTRRCKNLEIPIKRVRGQYRTFLKQGRINQYSPAYPLMYKKTQENVESSVYLECESIL